MRIIAAFLLALFAVSILAFAVDDKEIRTESADVLDIPEETGYLVVDDDQFTTNSEYFQAFEPE